MFKDKKELTFKITLLIVGIFIACYGTAITIRSSLGTSPIACPPYIMTFFTPLTIGMTTFLVNALFLIGQIVILKKQFPLIQLIQLLIAFLTGVFMDLAMHLSGFIHSGVYFYNIFLCIIGSAILGLGIAIEVFANITYMPGDGLVKVINETTKFDYGKIKIAFDVSLVLITVLLGIIFVHRVEGVREGTLISALLVGFFVDIFLDFFNNLKNNKIVD